MLHFAKAPFKALLAVSTLSCLQVAVAAQNSPFHLPPPANEVDAMRRDFFAYDSDLPLRPNIRPLDQNSVWNRFYLTYVSVHDQRVTAILALPRGFAPPYPAVILVHGSGGHKDTSYIALCSEMLTSHGYATISLDTQYHGDRKRPDRSGDIHMPDSYTMRDAWVQSVVDMRRAVDYLVSRPDIVASKIGYLGFSQGGMLGAVLGGVEERISSFCLVVPGGGIVDLVNHLDRYPVLKAHWSIARTPEVMKKVEDIANITDPIYYVGGILPRPLLMIVANDDEIIPPEATQALIAAAHAGPDNVKRWNSGHAMNPNAVFDIRDFFVRVFGKRSRRPSVSMRDSRADSRYLAATPAPVRASAQQKYLRE